MFTGIIAAVGTIVERTPLAGGQRILIDTAALGLDDVALGREDVRVAIHLPAEEHSDVSEESLRGSELLFFSFFCARSKGDQGDLTWGFAAG